jgi:hypothetical protein
VDLLVVHASQADRIQPQTGDMGPCVRVEVKGCVGVTVGMAVETADSEAWFLDFPVVGLIELLLREGGRSSLSPSFCTGVRMPCMMS